MTVPGARAMRHIAELATVAWLSVDSGRTEMYYVLSVERPNQAIELTTHESWGDVLDAIDSMDYYMKNGTVTSFEIRREGDDA